MIWFEFNRVCFIQESMVVIFGVGYMQVCVVDVGVQKILVICVEDGFVIEDLCVNFKYGGYDIMEMFIKMMFYDNFLYQDINFWRCYDFLFVEEFKIKYCIML